MTKLVQTLKSPFRQPFISNDVQDKGSNITNAAYRSILRHQHIKTGNTRVTEVRETGAIHTERSLCSNQIIRILNYFAIDLCIASSQGLPSLTHCSTCYARRMGVISKVRSEEKNVLLFDAGDYCKERRISTFTMDASKLTP